MFGDCPFVMVPAIVRPQFVAAASIVGRFRVNELAYPPIANTSSVDCSFDRPESTNACPVPPAAQGWPCTQSSGQKSTGPSTRDLRRVRQRERFASAPIASSIRPLNRTAKARATLMLTYIGALVGCYCGNPRDPQIVAEGLFFARACSLRRHVCWA
jgi:hypothetical protein